MMTDGLRYLIREYGSDLGPLKLTKGEFEELKRACAENGEHWIGLGPFWFCDREVQVKKERGLSFHWWSKDEPWINLQYLGRRYR